MPSAITVCAIAVRQCAGKDCATVFVTIPRNRRKYCSDICAARAYMARHARRYTLEGALAQLKRNRKSVHIRRSQKPVQRPRPVVPHSPAVNTYRPGMIAFTLLYGGPTFSFNASDGTRITGGGASRGRTRSGPRP